MVEETRVVVSTQRKRTVTFTCRVCGKEFTYESFTGRPVVVCTSCWPEYRKAQKTAYMRRFRARRRGEQV